MKKPIDLYIDNLKRLVGAKSDSELAKSLSLSKQAIAAWRRREAVPLAQQRILTGLYGPAAAFNEEIGYDASMKERQAILSAFLRIFDQNRKLLDPTSHPSAYEHWAEALLSFESDMQRLVRSGGWIGFNATSGPSEYSIDEISRVLTALVQAKEDTLGILRTLVTPDAD